MSKVKIAGLLTPEEALAVLFNASGPQDLGKIQYTPGHTMTPEEAAKVLEKGSYVDYLEGRVIKVDFSNMFELDTTLYDRDNGKDAAETVIFEELDRRDGGSFRELKRLGIPVRLFGNKIERLNFGMSPCYRYTKVMGGTLDVYVHEEFPTTNVLIKFSFFHPLLGDKPVSMQRYVTDMHVHQGMFNVMVRYVLNMAIDKMLNNERGPND